ncbi:MAG TPA: hypothetical protein VNG12_26620, partial [Acidimicrobiales bacterium]|nr:hypothetical protein [Acidimicrobiales bacterium]
LGDQPDVAVGAVSGLVQSACGFALGVCRYRDGVGHPFWFGRQVFDDLLCLHGDKAVWKLLESGRYPVAYLDVPDEIPLDVDTWEDYMTLLDRTAEGTKK